jgi:hypothetical protein
VAGGLLAFAIAGSALAFGAQHTPVLLLVTLAAAGSAALLGPARVPQGAWLLFALSSYCLVQLVPMPFGVLERLSPASADVWRQAFVEFGVRTPRFATLSVDPGATALEALKWAAYACTYCAAVGWRARHRALGLALLVFGSALAVCLVTLLHGALNLERIYGIFRPTDASRWVHGPFVNGNNLAGYLNLGLFTGAGIALSRRVERGTPALVASIVLLGTGSLLASSRAGTVSLLVGVALLTVLSMRQRAGPSGKFAAIIGAIALSGLALAAVISGRRVFSTLLDTQVRTKIMVWRWTLDLISDFPVFGAGRGGFEAAFQPYRHPLDSDYSSIVVHAESFPLQWAADWGLPVCLVALAGFGFLGRRLWGRAARDPLAAGLVTGLCALFLQNLADLGLELFSVMAAAVVAFVAADEAPATTTTTRPLAPPQGLVVLTAALVLWLGATPPQVERQRARQAYAKLTHASAQELRDFRARLEPALERHPGDPYLPLLGGLATWRLREDPMRWLGRALERSPLDGNTHLALSDVFAARKALPQSLLHARYAALYGRDVRDQALSRAASRVRTRSDLTDTFPNGLPGSELLAPTCALLVSELAAVCWREVLDRGPAPDAERALAGVLLLALETETPPCVSPARAVCSEEARQLLRRLDAHDAGKDWQVAELGARFLAIDGRLAEAAKFLLDRCPGGTEAGRCFDHTLEFALASGDVTTIEAIAARYAPIACGDPAACAALHERVGRACAEHAADTAALHHFLSAAKARPTIDRWLLVAETATRLGSASTARLALERASREPVPSPEHTRRLEQLQSRLAGVPAIE